MGLIRDALSGPWLTVPEEEEDVGCTIRLLDGSEVAIAVPYRKLSALVSGRRSAFGPPAGLSYEERRGWLRVAPPASDGEALLPLTAIAAIVPGLPEEEPAPWPEDEDDLLDEDRGNGGRPEDRELVDEDHGNGGHQ